MGGKSRLNTAGLISFQMNGVSMKKLNATLLVLAVLFLFAGCAAPIAKADKASQLQAKSFTPKAGLSNIYVYRPTGFMVKGGATSFRVTVDKQFAGVIEVGSFALIEVPPGKHTVALPMSGPFGEAGAEILIATEAERNYYLSAESGWFVLKLQQVDEEIGKREITKCSMVSEPDNVIKAREKSAQERRDATEQTNFEKAVEIYRNTTPKPVLSEEARKFKVQAEFAVQEKQFAKAAELYGKALDIAPWWSEGHFNRALILGETKNYWNAMREMKRYLHLEPDASNARAAQDKIYVWESKVK